MIKHLISQLIVLALFSTAFGQTTNPYVRCSIDSLPPAFFNRSLFVLGEFHDHMEVTAQYELGLIDKLVRSGKREIDLFFETAPAEVYFINKYYNSNDTILRDDPCVDYFFPLIKGLKKYQGTVKFRFIAMDVETSADKLGATIFFRQIMDTVMHPVAYWLNDDWVKDTIPHPSWYWLSHGDILDLWNAYGAHEIKKAATKIRDSQEDLLLFKKSLDSADFSYFVQEINVLCEYGCMRGTRRKKGMYIRNQHMAKVINQELKDTVPGVVLVGAGHIEPGEGNQPSQLAQLIQHPDRKGIAFIPIVYQYPHFLIGGRNKFYHTRPEFSKAIGDKIYDAILIQCQ